MSIMLLDGRNSIAKPPSYHLDVSTCVQMRDYEGMSPGMWTRCMSERLVLLRQLQELADSLRPVCDGRLRLAYSGPKPILSAFEFERSEFRNNEMWDRNDYERVGLLPLLALDHTKRPPVTGFTSDQVVFTQGCYVGNSQAGMSHHQTEHSKLFGIVLVPAPVSILNQIDGFKDPPFLVGFQSVLVIWLAVFQFGFDLVGVVGLHPFVRHADLREISEAVQFAYFRAMSKRQNGKRPNDFLVSSRGQIFPPRYQLVGYFR